ncbi:MAG: hypothetical protein FP826_12530 [Sphingomonadales bacterium]|nr:hypothetical protein [Sphingomonadales bacterium]MBU3991188.1 hypothetical protein [Alphaproteobacteria bacterium]
MDRYAKIHNIDLLTRQLRTGKAIANRGYFESLIRRERSELAVMDARDLGASEHGLYSGEYGSADAEDCLRAGREHCENSLFPCMIVDPRPGLRIVAANAAAAAETLIPREELIGRRLYEMSGENDATIEAQSIPGLLASFATVMATKAAHCLRALRFDVRLPDARTDERYWRIQNSPILDGKREVLFIRCEFFNISRPVRPPAKA